MKVLVTPEFSRAVERMPPEVASAATSIYRSLAKISPHLFFGRKSPFPIKTLDGNIFVLKHKDSLIFYRKHDDAIVLLDVKPSGRG